ncbi:MAG: tRNA (N6-threonylcarbamoyladenosine(37)-N6)-methyltransferase TrmO [Thermovirgaceae bacterium]
MSVSCIGMIRTPHKTREGTPIQPPGAKGVIGKVEVDPVFSEGLSDLEGFSHVILLYHFHLSEGHELTVRPFLDKKPHGVFSTRAPRRPTPIGLSVVRLVSVDGCTLTVEGVDMVDETPLLDIKPFVPAFDVPEGDVRTGWLEQNSSNAQKMKADKRFL